MARYTYDELQKKTDDELDRIKKVLDVYQSEDKYAFERKKFETENLRFFLIAILTALISLGSSYFIESFKQKNNDKVESRKEYKTLEHDYFHEKDAQIQNHLACALARFDSSYKDEAVERHRSEYLDICNLINKNETQSKNIEKIDTNSIEIKSAAQQLKVLDSTLQSYKREQKISPASAQKNLQERIEQVNKDIDKIATSIPQIKNALASTDTIETNVKQIEVVNSAIKQQDQNQSTVLQKSAVTWFKEGYFLQFGDYRISLKSLDKNKGIEVEVCRTILTTECESPIAKQSLITYNSPLIFSDSGARYVVSLENIDHAGKNPFTLAAYITFGTYK